MRMLINGDDGMTLLLQPRKYEAVMGEFLKLPQNFDVTGQVRTDSKYTT